jgi:hypothetical protein
MPRAGFYAIQAAKIRFGRDGNWYADDERITNGRIVDLFARHLRRAPDGGYVIRMGDEQAAIEVEDTPFVVVAAAVEPTGVVRIELNDHTTEVLDPKTLEIGAEQVLYCRVKARTERARFLRSAYYELARYVSEVEPGRFVLQTGGIAHPIRPAS